MARCHHHNLLHSDANRLVASSEGEGVRTEWHAIQALQDKLMKRVEISFGIKLRLKNLWTQAPATEPGGFAR